MIDGFDYARAFILSAKSIRKSLLSSIKRWTGGGTLLHGQGIYTGENREVLFAVVTRKEVARLRELVRDIDPGAFVIISNIHEYWEMVFGREFRRYEWSAQDIRNDAGLFLLLNQRLGV